MDQSRVVRLEVPSPPSPPLSRTPTKTDYRKTFHLPSNQPSPQPPSEVTAWTSVRSSLYTAEDEFNKRRFSGAGRPISLFADDSNNSASGSPTSPMASPLTRSRANSTKKPSRESTQLQIGNNSMLATYFQTSFVSKNNVRASRLETAAKSDMSSDDETFSLSRPSRQVSFYATIGGRNHLVGNRRQKSEIIQTEKRENKSNQMDGPVTAGKGQRPIVSVELSKKVPNVGRQVAKKRSSQAEAKFQRTKKIGVLVPCISYMEREEEQETTLAIKTLCDSPLPGFISVAGPSGYGKTSMVAWIFNEPKWDFFLCHDCHIHIVVWLNGQKLSRFADDDSVIEEVADALQFEFGLITPRTRVKIKSLLETDSSKRIVFIVDDVGSKRTVEQLLQLGSSVRVIAIAKDVREVGLYGHKNLIRTTLLREFSDRKLLHYLEDLKERLGFGKLKSLGPMCQSSALIAVLLRACFGPGDANDSQRVYAMMTEALSKKIEDGVSLIEPFRTIAKLTIFTLAREPSEIKLYFTSFLIFDPNQPVELEDAEILWGVTPQEAENICLLLMNKGLLFPVEIIRMDQRLKLGFAMHPLVSKAAVDAARLGLHVDADVNSLKSRFFTNTVLHRATTLHRKCLLSRIINETEVPMLERLCRQKYGSAKQNYLHFLYNSRWTVDNFGVEKCVSAELLIMLISKLHKSRVDVAELLAQEDLMGECCLVKISESDSTTSPEAATLKAVVLRLGKKMLCKISAVRYWTAKFSESNQNSELFMAALRGDYSTCEDLVRYQPNLLAKRNKLGETPLMAAVGCGHMPVAKLLHRSGADLNEADFNGMTPVLIAAATGRVDMLDYFRRNGGKLHATNDFNRTATMLASAAGHDTTVKLLLAHGPSVDAIDMQGVNAVMLAAQNAHAKTLKLLLDSGGPDLETVDNIGNDALLYAAEGGSQDVAELLINRGVRLDVANHSGMTAMMRAAEHGNVEILQVLNNKGAKINARDRQGATPLFYAVGKKHLRSSKLLISFGAVCDVHMVDGTTVLIHAIKSNCQLPLVQLLTANGAKLDAGDKNGWTPFHHACVQEYVEIVEFLIASGCQSGAKTKLGQNAVHLCADRGLFEVVKLLAFYRVPLNTCTSSDGQTPLMLACAQGFTEICDYFLQNGCPPNTTDRNGQTALMKASLCGHSAIVRLLIENGASVNCVDAKGQTALHHASGGNHTKIMQILMEHRAKLAAKDQFGSTPLLLACHQGNTAAVELLLSSGGDIKDRSHDGKTCLIKAVEKGNLDVCRMLLDRNVEVTAGDNDGATALMEAAHYGHTDIIRLLFRAGANVNQLDKRGCSALFYAIEGGQLEAVKELKSQGALLNLKSRNSVTPLMSAAYGRHEQIVEYLQQNGAK